MLLQIQYARAREPIHFGHPWFATITFNVSMDVVRAYVIDVRSVSDDGDHRKTDRMIGGEGVGAHAEITIRIPMSVGRCYCSL